ncbi:tectonic-1 [Tachysurus fulvidraco]|uniref:tectonic-1 n=1 Tax=Tachysurus fulvidraco TaxID=1234273 RepID=UPI001FED6B30|nr:tectonic-1 [Tachysurus fulvidraco]XP_047660939.1 tectonic-1 [Tachysurus fulvidraco]XP_047660940.1 tectonic-1 [Tachysurus fulvidraco]
MAALLWTFILMYFGNTVCVNNASSNRVNVTHVVSKDTFVFDKAFNLTGSQENVTLSPTPQVSSPGQSVNEPLRDKGTENSTFNTTAFKPTEEFTFTPTGLQTTETPTSTKSTLVTNPTTEGGGISSLPLPLSLPQPVTEVSAMCPCNVQREQCDINCCCDPDCTQELALFTQCSVQKVVGDTKLCSQDAALYTLTVTPQGLSQVMTSVQQQINPDVFCIQSANYEQGMSFITPTIPTENNFDSLFDRFAGFFFSSGDGRAVKTPAQGNSLGYVYGDLIQTIDDAHQRGFFRLPASATAANCLDTNPAAFLKDQTSRCLRSFTLQNCTELEALNLNAYTSFLVLSGKDNGADLVSVERETITLQSLEGTQTLVTTDADYTPIFNGHLTCNRVVLQVKYTVRFGDAGQIVKVTASFVLGAVNESTSFQQEFQITFIQETSSGATRRTSGNPGYVVGLPLVAGWRTAKGIILSSGPDGSLTVLKSTAEQDCLLGPTQRSPILFGTDVVSGCTFRLEDNANCSLLSEVILRRLKGQIFPNYVASFGNSLPQNPMDWVPIENQTTPTTTQGCSIPVSYHLEIKWTKYGTLLNPQAQIVNVMETIQTNTSPMPSSSTGGVVSVTSSVSFIDVSRSASPGFRAPPTIDAKLPSDFFFPFV